MDEETKKKLKKSLKLHARALEIPDGASEDFINHAIKSADASLKSKKTITPHDIKRTMVKELKKYHRDLAYVYEIHDTII